MDGERRFPARRNGLCEDGVILTPKRELIRISKFLSYVLRHNPDSIGLRLDSEGWTSVDQLLSCAARNGRNITPERLKELVAKNDKNRFGFSQDRQRLRATYGHSIEVELNLPPVTPPPVLYHGTARQFIVFILKTGIKPSGRGYVHLSTDRETGVKVGTRHGEPIVLSVDSKRMHEDGFRFYCPVEGIWLVIGVPPEYVDLGAYGNRI